MILQCVKFTSCAQKAEGPIFEVLAGPAGGNGFVDEEHRPSGNAAKEKTAGNADNKENRKADKKKENVDGKADNQESKVIKPKTAFQISMSERLKDPTFFPDLSYKQRFAEAARSWESQGSKKTKPEGQEFGCSKCVYSANGCRKCNAARFADR